jgi:glycosyltransferase involved in cell wall biosynthesis
MRTLVVDQEPPQATRDGGAARMVTLLRLLAGMGHSVAFASLRPWPAGLVATEQRLTRLGVEIAARDGTVGSWLSAQGPTLDLVVASRLPVAEVTLRLLRGHCPSARFVYDATHVEHLAKFRLAKLTGNRPLLVSALRDQAVEREVVAAADAVFVTSEDDADRLRACAAAPAGIHVIPAVDLCVDAHEPDSRPRAGIVFLGFLGVVENALAVRRLVEGVWPLVEAQIGPTPVTVIGAAPPEWLLCAARRNPRLTVTGHLPEIVEALRRAAVMVIPLRGGAGLKTKVLEAFARRLPVVATADGIRGVPAVDGFHVLLAESDAELAGAAARVLGDAALGSVLTERAATLVHEHFSDEVYRAALQEALVFDAR